MSDPKIELRRMLKGSLALEHPETFVAQYLTDLGKRVGRKLDKRIQIVSISVFSDGTGNIAFGEGAPTFGGYSKPIIEVMTDAEAWVAADHRALVNATLGLTEDGGFSGFEQEAAE